MDTLQSDIEQEYSAILKKNSRTSEDLKRLEVLSQELSKEFEKSTKMLKREILNAGLRIESINDLMNTSEVYPEAIPILVEHLSKKYNKNVLEAIVRSVTVKEARGIGLPQKLIKLYNKVPLEQEFESLRWAISNAIWFTVTKKDKAIVNKIQEVLENDKDTVDKHRFVSTLKKLG